MRRIISKSAPLFVLGAARSGTTILAKILNSHPRILLTDETAVFLALSGLIANSREGVTAGLWYGKTYNSLWADLIASKSRELVLEFYERIAQAEGKENLLFWGDKHPQYCNCLDFILEIFPNARFVFLAREPRDVAVSLAEMNKLVFREGIEAVKVFFDRYHTFFAAHPELPLFMLKYEDLVNDYLKATQSVLGWLGLAMDSQVETFIRQRASLDAHGPMLAGETSKDFSRSVGRWRNVFGQEDEALARSLLGDVLTRYGYDEV